VSGSSLSPRSKSARKLVTLLEAVKGAEALLLLIPSLNKTNLFNAAFRLRGGANAVRRFLRFVPPEAARAAAIASSSLLGTAAR
jgi:hypothetical protein